MRINFNHLSVTLLAVILFSACNSDTEEQSNKISQPEENKSINPSLTNSDPQVNNEPILEIPDEFTSAPTSKKSDREYCIDDVYKNLQPQEQTFTFSNLGDTTIIGLEGTKIYIPSKCFQDIDGNIITDNINFTLKEAYDYPAMTGAGLSTTSNNDLLETGGMVHLAATTGNKDLEIRMGKEISIQFNSELENMSFFDAERTNDGEINWVLNETSNDPYPVIACLDDNFGDDLKNYFGENYKIPKPDMIRLLGSSWTSNVSFNKQGELMKDLPCEQVDHKLPANQACSEFNRIATSLKDSVESIFFPAYNVNFNFACMQKEEYDNMMDRKKAQKMWASGYGVENLFFTTSMGWKNCDRFRSKETPRTDIAFHETNYSDSADVRIFFHKFKAMVRGTKKHGKYQFLNIPKDEKISLVGIKVIDGQVHYAEHQTKVTGESIKKDLDYEPVTLKELEERLGKL